MQRWVAEKMAERYREVARDFRRYPKLAALAEKAEQDARDVLELGEIGPRR